MEKCTVSVGKFPPEYTEDQILAIAKSVGPVQELKLKFDDLTGRSKGFADIRYVDNETARSAVRNLSYMPIANGRFLRCVFTDDLTSDEKLPPNLPLGSQISINQQANQVVAELMNSIDKGMGMKVLQDIKTMSQENPELTQVLLANYPQLAMALVEVALKFGATNPDIIELVRAPDSRDIVELSSDQLQLLRAVAQTPDEKISELDDDKAEVMRQLREDIISGKFGDVVAN
ncbi:mRNA 3'-end-processing protein Rna15p [Diutina catenulata]